MSPQPPRRMLGDGARHKLDPVAYSDAAASDDGAVESDGTAELADDPPQHRVVLLLRIRVEGRHHAPRPQTGDRDNDIAEAQVTAGPAPLGEPVDAGDHDGGAQPATVDAERGD